ncbi:PTS transporter subunit EIIC [Clostridium paraputrificum]|uniref:PTS transporter subunit EIIC n=1 Tax=Clostridium paraputrificum TaxID=29363 RepID=UPI003D356E21
MKEKMQQLGQSMLIPISIIAIGSLCMGVGGALTAENTISSLGLSGVIYKGSFLFNFFTVVKAMGDVVFKNLPVFFAVGVSFGLANKEKGWAAFSGLAGFLTMHLIISTVFKINGITSETTTVDYFVKEVGMSNIDAVRYNSLYASTLGYFSFNMGMFGGLIIGVLTSIVHNKFFNIKLPLVLEFFAGTRTVPILMIVVGTLVGVACYYIWPPIGLAITNFSGFIQRSGLFGTFVWACADKSLLPLGLHHLITQPIRWTALGGSMEVAGQIVEGTTNIFMAQLADPNSGKLLVRGFQSGRIVIHFGALPGAALAMYTTAKKSKRKAISGLLITAVATMILFGVTEPIEFTFLFVAPWLFYLVHVPLVGLSFVLCEFFNVSSYGGGVKDILPTLLQPDKLNFAPYIILVPLFFAIYYFLFSFLIKKFDVKTPGRGNDDNEEIRLNTKKDYQEKVNVKEKGEEKKEVSESKGSTLATQIVEALGGDSNIVNLGNCMTRLRVTVKDISLVKDDEAWKKQLEAIGVVRKGNALQIIYGTRVTMIASDVKELLSDS